MTQLQYLALGYALIWILLALYVAGLHRRLGRARREIETLRRWMEERAGGNASGRDGR